MATNHELNTKNDHRQTRGVEHSTSKGHRSLFCLSESNILRRSAEFIVNTKAFDYFILTSILANCVVLALDVPLPNKDKSSINNQLDDSEIVFLVIFTIEAVLKIIALGFLFQPGSYLRDGWNVLDFIVVVTGYIGYLVSGNLGNVRPLRAFRVLRPLKLVSNIPSLQVVLKSLMRAMLPLFRVLVLNLFVITIYATVGVSFLVNDFHATCYSNLTGKPVPVGETVQPCDYYRKGWLQGRTCDESKNESCRQNWKGPNSGITTFDNIWLGTITVSQCITMEGWTDVMYSTFYAKDKNGYFFTIYYVSLILFGSFFMLNLVLGVLSGEFAKQRAKIESMRNFFKLRRQEKINRDVEEYRKWINRADEIIVEDLVSETDPSQTRIVAPAQFILNPIQVLAAESGKGHRLNLPERHKRFPKFRLQERVWRLRVRRLVENEIFFWGVALIVLLNTICLATEHYNQPYWLTDIQEKAEIVFISIFLVEMFLKLYGLGPSTYFRSTFNTFDFFVIMFGLLELIIKKPLGISVLRSLRLLKIFKMTKYWSSLRNLVRSLVNSIKSIISLMFLLFLFIVIFSLLGMQFFGGRFDSKPRTNFDDFPNSMLTVFQILTGEDWNAVMYEGINAYGGANDALALVIGIYFALLVIIGNYTLLNIFLAIAVDNLTTANQLTKDEENEKQKKKEGKDHEENERKTFHSINSNEMTSSKEKSSSTITPSSEKSKDEEDEHRNGSTSDKTKDNTESKQALRKNIKKYQKAIKDETDVESQRVSQEQINGNDENLDRKPLRTFNRRQFSETVPIRATNALFLFGPENKFRRLCHDIVNLRHFDNFMLIIIIVSSIVLAIEDPVDDCSDTNKVIRYFDYVFTSIFAFEVFVKLIDLGAVLHRGSYFRNRWNFIDALVVCCNIASLSISKCGENVSGGSLLKVLRVLRVLRPLKMMNKLKKLEAVFQCMWKSFKNVANILLITLLFLFIFAVVGVQLFNGKFFHCTDDSKMFKNECKGNYIDFGEATSITQINKDNVKKREWKLREFNFNNVFIAMLTLYTSATGEGWPSAMHHTMDVTEVDKGPIRNYSVENAIFYITFVIVFVFFFLNVFVALVVLTFQEQEEKQLVKSTLDRNQRDCLNFVINAKPLETFMPTDKESYAYKVWWIVVSKPFEFFIMGLIVINTVVLMMEYRNEPKDYSDTLQYLNAALTFLFTLEAALKLFAFKQSYFKDRWNVFDFIVVVGSIVDTGLTFRKYESLPFDPSMFRIFRAARLMKVLKKGSGVRVLLWAFLQSFKALPYVTLLIFLVFFIYAVMGMQLFGKIKVDNGTEINEYNNFQTIMKSLLLLFRSSTGENWQNIMSACFTGALCDEKAKPSSNNCGSTAWAIAYFCSFTFLCMFFMLNLFVAVIMDNFDYLTRDQSILGPPHLDEFVQMWSVYDPEAKGEIPYIKLYNIMKSLSPPVGFGWKCPKFVAYRRLIAMNVPVSEDKKIDFTSTLFALVRTSLKIATKGNMNSNDTKLRKMILGDWPKISPKSLDKMIPKNSDLDSHPMTVGKIYCAELIAENYRQKKKKRQEEENPASQKPNVFKRFLGSVSRSIYQKRTPTSEDGPRRRHHSDTITSEDFRRSSSYDDFMAKKGQRSQDNNFISLNKFSLRQAFSASSSPQPSFRKHKIAITLSLPSSSYQMNENEKKKLNGYANTCQTKENALNLGVRNEKSRRNQSGFGRQKEQQTARNMTESYFTNCNSTIVDVEDIIFQEKGSSEATSKNICFHSKDPKTLEDGMPFQDSNSPQFSRNAQFIVQREREKAIYRRNENKQSYDNYLWSDHSQIQNNSYIENSTTSLRTHRNNNERYTNNLMDRRDVTSRERHQLMRLRSSNKELGDFSLEEKMQQLSSSDENDSKGKKQLTRAYQNVSNATKHNGKLNMRKLNDYTGHKRCHEMKREKEKKTEYSLCHTKNEMLKDDFGRVKSTSLKQSEQLSKATDDCEEASKRDKKPRSEIYDGIFGHERHHTPEYYDRMIQKINEQIYLAVGRSKNSHTLNGSGTDDDNWC